MPEPPRTPHHRTGVAEVDDVLREVAEAGRLPLSEQAAAFENAHRRLRQALDAG